LKVKIFEIETVAHSLSSGFTLAIILIGDREHAIQEHGGMFDRLNIHNCEVHVETLQYLPYSKSRIKSARHYWIEKEPSLDLLYGKMDSGLDVVKRGQSLIVVPVPPAIDYMSGITSVEVTKSKDRTKALTCPARDSLRNERPYKVISSWRYQEHLKVWLCRSLETPGLKLPMAGKAILPKHSPESLHSDKIVEKPMNKD
jgi:hypothetical protein